LEKGIISVVKKNNVLHFSAATPDRLNDFIEAKEKEIEEEKDLVQDMLPMLMKKYEKTIEQSDVEVFYGWEGMKTVFGDVSKSLKKGDTNYIFGASMGQDPERTDRFFRTYYRHTQKKGFGIRIIFNEDVRKKKPEFFNMYKEKPHEARYLKQVTFTEFNLYKDTVLIVMLLKQPIVTRIRNKEAAESCKKFFDTMWALAKN